MPSQFLSVGCIMFGSNTAETAVTVLHVLRAHTAILARSRTADVSEMMA